MVREMRKRGRADSFYVGSVMDSRERKENMWRYAIGRSNM